MPRFILLSLSFATFAAVLLLGWAASLSSTSAVGGFNRDCNGDLEVTNNPAMHPVNWSDGPFKITVEGGKFSLQGPSPVIDVTGSIDELGAIEASGTGVYQGFTTSVLFIGTLIGSDLKNPESLGGQYSVGPEGELPGDEPIDYSLSCPIKPPTTPTETPPDDKFYEIIVLKEDADTLQGLEDWEINIYAGPNCQGTPFDFGFTDEDGILTFPDLEAGTYSVEEKPQDGWNPVSDECQDVELPAGSGISGLPDCPIQPNLPHPEPGCDEFHSLASVSVNFSNPPLDSLDCDLSGPTQIRRNPLAVVGNDAVPVEMTAMELTGTCVPGNVSVTVRESSSEASTGLIVEQDNEVPDVLEFKAESYFDIFFEVETPLGTLHNQEPIRMECKIQDIPPSGCFYEPDVGDVPLYNDDKKLVGELKHARHIPIGPKNDLVIFTNERKDDVTPTPTGEEPTVTPTATATNTPTLGPQKTPQPQRTRHGTLRCIRGSADKVTGSVTVTEKKDDKPPEVVFTATCSSNDNPPYTRGSYKISAGATKNISMSVTIDNGDQDCDYPGYSATQRVTVRCPANPSGIAGAQSGGVSLLDTEFEAGDGDANKNGTVDSIDAALILQSVAGLIDTRPNSDVNGNGDSDAIDAALVLQFTAGLVEVLPV